MAQLIPVSLRAWNLIKFNMASSSSIETNRSNRRIKEIDGLRAIALLGVMIYHGRFGNFMRGGFLGVDMFFVISGYVITLSLRKSILRGTLNYKDFLLRRLFRLTPALLATLLITNLFCSAMFSRKDRFRAVNLSLGSLFSISNIQLWMESNYFDFSSLRKPFLHTWSLSVEWQFYITWALIVPQISLNISSSKNQILALLSIALLSTLCAEWVRKIFPNAAFFNFCFRYVEFMCGAIPAWNYSENESGNSNYFLKNSYRTAISILSLVAVLSFLKFFKDTFPFPGVTSLPICIATSFLITQVPGTPVGRILSLKALQWLGKVSYSVYLVHWPVQVLLNYMMMHHSTAVQRFIGTLVSFLFGYILNISVEKPFQESSSKKQTFSRRVKLTVLGFFCALLVGEGVYMRQKSIGFSQKTSVVWSAIENSYDFAVSRGWEIRPKCRSIGRHDNLKHFKKCNPVAENEIVLVGDSHAADLWYSLNFTFPQVSTIEICGTGCGLHKSHDPNSGCGKIFGAAQKNLRKRRSRIRAAIFVSRWHVLSPESIGSGVLNSFVDYFQQRTNATIFILGPRPEFKPHPNEVFERSRRRENLNELEIRTNRFMRVENNSEVVLHNFAVKKNVRFLSIPKIMCNATRIGQPSNEYSCRSIDREIPSSLYCDNSHYNRAGAMKLVQYLKPDLDKLLK